MHWPPKPGYARREARGREEGAGNTGATGRRLLRRPNTATDSKQGAHGYQGFHREASAATLVADDLDDPAPVALAVELEEEHALPGAEAELAVADGDRLSG
jgi:hypothetical protein